MSAPHNAAERAAERAIFASRWLVAPMYLGLAASLLLLLVKFGQKAWALFGHVASAGADEVIVGVLSLVDLSFVANLLLMVMFAGYENFVSKFDLADHPDRPDWMGHVGFGDVKLKLMTSIVAISAIHLLEMALDLAAQSDRDLAWGAGMLAVFVVSGVLLAVMDRVGR